MKEKFINKYSLSKTLRFSLIPIGETEKNFNGLILNEDKTRSEEYPKMKKLIDEYHKKHIDKTLSKIQEEDLSTVIKQYEELYNNKESDKEKLWKIETELRKYIAFELREENPCWDLDKMEVKKGGSTASNGTYEKMFEKEMIKELLIDGSITLTDEDRKLIKNFEKFTTYFVGFHENRKNMYTEEEQTTAISYRCINQNLPRFLDNRKIFNEKIKDVLLLEELKKELGEKTSVEAMFSLKYFAKVLPQSGIDDYNRMIGGYSDDTGKKIKGLNEYINLYNQQQSDKSSRIPMLKPLYKQILSDRETVSFIPEAITDDDALLKEINEYYNNENELGINICSCIKESCSLIQDLEKFDSSGILINSKNITDISTQAFGSWNFIQDKWNEKYDLDHQEKRRTEKYYEDRKKAYKKLNALSIKDLESLTNSGGKITAYLKEEAKKLSAAVSTAYDNAKELIEKPYNSAGRLSRNEQAVELIKKLMDSIKEVERFLLNLYGWRPGEQAVDDNFYGALTPYMDLFDQRRHFYDQVRNYLTAKPYSTDKFKLNFECATFLNGWDKNKEKDNLGIILRRGDNYYLAIMSKGSKKVFSEGTTDGDGYYEKMEYKLIPDPIKMFPKCVLSKKRRKDGLVPDEIWRIAKEDKTYKTNIDDCHTLIDYYKESIPEVFTDWKDFFKFKETKEYNNINEFFEEVAAQSYKLNFDKKIPVDVVEGAVKEGKLYLFQIYNKDFSKDSKGTPNLHTLYFRMLFHDSQKQHGLTFRLNGGAEMFLRPESIKQKDTVVHKAKTPIKSKNPDNPKKESTFAYDLIKDKRFTKRQFELHIPITLNFNANEKEKINDLVRKNIRDITNLEDIKIIGIDRGERNLIYLCVIDGTGKIIEQISLNEIINNYKNSSGAEIEVMTDYHKLLDVREKERQEARKSWQTIENIKELKEGYLSHVINKICSLVRKYDNAIIAMEDLNYGFKRGRFKIEKQVYQKFENALISKLQFLVDKKVDPESDGGLCRAYQLVNKDSKDTHQNGIIFYVPASLTSKIDPTTGFVDMLHPKYTSVSEAQNFFNLFEDIYYDKDKDLFAFKVDYDKIPNASGSYIKKWTIYTNGKRIKEFRNPDKNNEWDWEEIDLTQEFKKLFEEIKIDFTKDLKKQIVSLSEKEHMEKLIGLLRLTLQMRNSIPNTDTDYIISPVMNSSGNFYNSNDSNADLPKNADANGAYNIARKALWAINSIRSESGDWRKTKITIDKKEWLKYAQESNK